MKIRSLLSLVTLTALVAVPTANGLTINATFVDGNGQTWDATRQGVVNQAISDWTSKILDNHTLNITFDFTLAGTSSYLAQWSGSRSYFAGDNIYAWSSGVTHTVHFNANLFSGTNYAWFDPTPTTSSDQPFEAWDLLSVTRHELGHALGFTSGFYYDNAGTAGQVDKWSSRIDASHVFNANGLIVQMDADNAHTDQSLSLLMSPALVNGTRREISLNELNMLAASYGYTVVPESSLSAGMCVGLSALVLAGRRIKRTPEKR